MTWQLYLARWSRSLPHEVALALAPGDGKPTRRFILKNADPRRWSPEAGKVTLLEKISVPSNLQPGKWQLMIQIADPSPSLHDDGRYAKTQLDQYTDLSEENKQTIEQVLPRENLLGFRGAYLETAQRLKTQQGKGGDKPGLDVDQVDFEFVLFASAVIDYDYIMALITRFANQPAGKLKMSKDQLIGLIQSDAKFMNEREDIAAYISTLKVGEGLSETAIREGFKWVKYVYIDDPISSLDENNAIAVANHLAQMLTTSGKALRTVVSSHHVLFFNVLSNELKKKAHRHFLKKPPLAQHLGRQLRYIIGSGDDEYR